LKSIIQQNLIIYVSNDISLCYAIVARLNEEGEFVDEFDIEGNFNIVIILY